MFFPASAHDVSAAIVALRKQPSVPFALKSGGHNWNRGFSSTNGGVLLSFRPNLRNTTLAADGQTAKVGPGSRWVETMQTLDKSNKYVVGGRSGDVGVGGYLLQGGISYLSAQYGFGCDNVVEYEFVTANGTILTVNENTHSDIFWALRGGGNIFGIVTMYTLRAYDVGEVWGGRVQYNTSQLSDINTALSEFIANNTDPRGAIILNWDILLEGGPQQISINFFSDAPSPPPHVFAPFNAVANISDNTTCQRYVALIDDGSTSAIGIRTTNAFSSLPNMPSNYMTSFLEWHWDQASESQIARSAQKHNILLISMALQPMPVGLQRVSASSNPGALSLDPNNGDKLWIEYNIGWNHTICDDHCPQELMRVVDEALAYQKQAYAGVKPTHYVSGNLSFVPYNPLFMNDAQHSQDVLGSYGTASCNRLKSLHEKLDPTNFFTSRQKGFSFHQKG